MVNYYIQTLGVVVTYEKCKATLPSLEELETADGEEVKDIPSIEQEVEVPCTVVGINSEEKSAPEQSHL